MGKANWANCLFFAIFFGQNANKKLKKQHEKAQVLLVFYMLKMEKMAMKFQFDMLKS